MTNTPSAREYDIPMNDTFLPKALAAIHRGDYEAIESLRDEIRSAHMAALVAEWKADLLWRVKDGFVALLMDQTGAAVRPVMEDALNSPTAESRAYALCSLTGNFEQFTDLLSGGSVDAQKVDLAIRRYRARQ